VRFRRLKGKHILGNRSCLWGIILLAGVSLFAGCAMPVKGEHKITEGLKPTKTRLSVTDKLSSEERELAVETDEWKVVLSLFYNGGIYKMFDKMYDPTQQDNLVTGPGYCQGGIFDYNVYLLGDQEFTTTTGLNSGPGRASLEIIENTPVRLRVRQKCHPRLNNGDGPANDKFVELNMVETTTEWTFYPTGRVNIKFDAVVAKDWDGICSRGPGGSGKGIIADGDTITAANGTDFTIPWVTHGDTIESTTGGWGPVQIVKRIGKDTLRLDTAVKPGKNLDFIIRRPNILDETISIHADGDPAAAPRKSYWQGGSDGDALFENSRSDGDIFRDGMPPVENDYVLAHWARPPREFGSLLALYEPLEGATYAVFNDVSWRNISYTQIARRGWRPFEEHHRHFIAQLGTEKGRVLPRIKSVNDALPFANDYRHPYAVAGKGTLQTGEGISTYGYHLASGAYHIVADKNKTAEIVFDAGRGGTADSAIAYQQPAVLVSGFDVADKRLCVELSKDSGATFEELPRSWYNVTKRAESSELGGGRRLLQLLCTIPTTATGKDAWVLRLSEKSRGNP